MSSKPTGTFCWADLMPADQPRALEFYATLAGWDALTSGPEYGGYALALIGRADDDEGEPVAGINPAQPGAAPIWTVYLASSNTRKTMREVVRNGGKELVAPMAIPGMGIAALAADPTGAPFGIWQTDGHDGFGHFGEPGGFTWAEVYSTDAAVTRDFFTKVMNMESRTLDESDAFTYYQLVAEGQQEPTFGVMQMANTYPAGTPSHFAAYICIDGVDEKINRIALRGATVLNAPQDTPFGRMATLLDSEGALIKIVDPSQATANTPA